MHSFKFHYIEFTNSGSVMHSTGKFDCLQLLLGYRVLLRIAMDLLHRIHGLALTYLCLAEAFEGGAAGLDDHLPSGIG